MSEESQDGSTTAANPSGVFNPLVPSDGHSSAIPSVIGASILIGDRASTATPQETPPPLVEFYTPSELREYRPPANQNMVGDYHFQRGSTTGTGGAAGLWQKPCSFVARNIGGAGAGEWFGYEIHCKFRTLILQNENGMARLHRDCEELGLSEDIDSSIRISAPPIFGMDLGNQEFRAQLAAAIKEFRPDLLAIDPWNAVTRDSFEKDYQQAFTWIREVLAGCPDRPACLIIHHLRKPKSDDRHRGRGLTNLLAGSYTIISVPRTVLVLQPASDDTDDNRVVITPAKNNDGELGDRSAWQRAEGTFTRVEDFEWDTYEKGECKARESKVQVEHIQELFENGELWLTRPQAVDRLGKIAKVRRTTAYNALKLNGRYADHLRQRDDGKIGLQPTEHRESSPN